ncbi:MAG TPA: futalosine hydrolase [Candidatus Aquilonibacter sp.]|nr:futalosine hydrolase [Candidatus Aquilonibacter sp.]
MILLACAVAKELDWLNSRAGVEVLVTGVGPVDAAARVSKALAHKHYDVVVNAGIAGAFPGCAEVGDGVVVGEELMEINRETGDAIVLPDGNIVIDRVPADSQLVEAVTALGFSLMRGITVARVTATENTAQRLRARGAEVETMEGFAVLRASQLAGVPSIEVRGISNLATVPAASAWDFEAGLRGLRRVLNATLDLLHTQSVSAD